MARQLDSSDPGDTTIQRFRYQFALVAQMLVDLLAEDPLCTHLLCEHFEDVLCMYPGGLCSAVQVKTRQPGRTPFKSTDPEILGSYQRFATIETQFANSVSRYVIISNCGFWSERKNSSSLVYVLDLAKQAKPEGLTSSPSSVKTFVKRISKKAKVAEETVFSAMCKTELQVGPGLHDSETRLIRALSSLPRLKSRSLPELEQIAEHLISLVFKASSFSLETALRDFLAMAEDPKAVAVEAAVLNKTISRDLVDQTISKLLLPNALLVPVRCASCLKVPKGLGVLEAKLSAGGVSVDNVDAMKSHKTSVEHFLASELHRVGEQATDDLYNHLRLITLTECLEAHDAVEREDQLYGTSMLIDVRSRLRQRWEQEKATWSHLRYEHFCGLAGVLTEECKVWWSPKFELQEEIL